jgi:peptidoglycan L-alanyl-D-glutamate endopeptidase CwlK
MTQEELINLLNPKVKELCKEHLKRFKEVTGYGLYITSTYRSIEEQNKLYAQGRTVKGAVVTNAKGGYSYHNFRVAYDVCPLKNGKLDWNDIVLFYTAGAIGEHLGLEWGHRFKSLDDKPHYQVTQGLSLADFRNGKGVVVS